MLIFAQNGRLGADTGADYGDFVEDGLAYTGNRPCFVWFRGDLYIIGYYTRPVVRHASDGGSMRLAGIRSPQMPVSVVPGAGSGGSTGACLAAITFVHKAGDIVLCESNFGNVVDVGTLTGQGRTWSTIDNTTAESRVTHVRGYVSMDGADFRMVWEADYGVTGYVENVRTTQATFIGPQEWNHHVPPATKFGHAFAGRMWYANSSQFPYRVWYSEPGFPQYTTSAGFLDTLDKEEITAIYRARNELLVFCERATYMVRPNSGGVAGLPDFVIEKLDSDVGCISHFGIQEIHNRLWFPGEDGIWIYDGSFRYLMKEMQPFWRTDWEGHRNQFLAGFAMHDRVNKVYIWVTNRPDREELENSDLLPGTVAYVGYYGDFDPSLAGDEQQPEWTLDLKNRFDSCGVYDENGELLIGSCDGKVRAQDWSNGDDDGDTLRKTLIIRRGHDLYFEPGDDDEDGKTMLQLWAYVKSESTPWSIYVRGGDEEVWSGLLPDNDFLPWKIDVAASAESEARTLTGIRSGPVYGLVTYAPKTVHYFVPQGVTGRGFMTEIRATAPIRLEYRGVGGLWGPGPAQRGPTTFELPTFNLSMVSKGPTPDQNVGDVVLPLGAHTFRITATYFSGSVVYPIAVSFAGRALAGAAVDYSDSGSIPGPPGNTYVDVGDVTLAFGDSYNLLVTAVDGAGKISNPKTGIITCSLHWTFNLDVLISNPPDADSPFADVTYFSERTIAYIVTPNYFSGGPTYPISVTVSAVAVGGGVSYVDTQPVPGPPGAVFVMLGSVDLHDGDSYLVTITATDAAGNIATSRTATIGCAVP